MSLGERKYFLDWLRVFAFAMLILFHVGLLYVTWYYNLKSPRLYPDFELAMNSLSAWRLVLLFFISGVASRFLLAKLSSSGFALDRVRRLLPVILLGMLVINPTQVYVEFLDKGYINPGYLDFWLNSYLMAEPYPNRIIPTWDHLWFLVYLLFYTLGLALVFRGRKEGAASTLPIGVLVVIPGVWLSFTNVLVSEINPVTFSLVDDWANHLRWIGVFAAGVLCAPRQDLWDFVRARRRLLLLFSVILWALQLAIDLYRRSGNADPFWDGVFYGAVAGVYGWNVVLALAGYAAEYLNRSSAALSYLTDAVLPIYVLHQPLLLIGAYLLFPLALPLAIEVCLLIAITGGGALLLYEACIRRWRVNRFLFGLKQMPQGA